MENKKQAIPSPSELSEIKRLHESDVVTLVDVNFAEYRRKNDIRTVRRNVSLPSWLDVEAEKAGLNVSEVL